MHFADGRTATATRDEVRAQIAAGTLSDGDRISVAGSLPRPISEIGAFLDMELTTSEDSSRSQSQSRPPQSPAPSAGVAPGAAEARAARYATGTGAGRRAEVMQQRHAAGDREPGRVAPVERAPPRLQPTAPERGASPIRQPEAPAPRAVLSDRQGANAGGASKAQQSAQPVPFEADLFALDGATIYDAVCRMPLDEVLGVPLASTKASVLTAYQLRRNQLERHPDASVGDVARRSGIADAIRVIERVSEIATDSGRLREYRDACAAAGRPVPFRDHVAFERGTLSELPNAYGPISVEAGDALDEANALVEAYEARRLGKPDPRRQRAGAGARPGDRIRQRVTGAFQAIQGRSPELRGSATRGPIAYGVGDPQAGLTVTVGGFVLLMAVVASVCFMSTLDLREAAAGLSAPMLWIRAATMVLLTFIGVRILRGESLTRLGWRPSGVSGVAIALGVAAVGAVAARLLLPLAVSAEAAMQTVLGVIAVRAIAEALFFDAFIARTLLIEHRSRVVALGIAAGLYGVYANSYAFMWDPTGDHASPLGTPAYALMVGVPAALAFYHTRAWWVSALVRALILGAAAAAGVSAAVEVAGAAAL